MSATESPNCLAFRWTLFVHIFLPKGWFTPDNVNPPRVFICRRGGSHLQDFAASRAARKENDERLQPQKHANHATRRMESQPAWRQRDYAHTLARRAAASNKTASRNIAGAIEAAISSMRSAVGRIRRNRRNHRDNRESPWRSAV